MLLENFTPGILSEPAKLPPGTFALSLVENLRTNTDGHLINRARVVETLFDALDAEIEGLANKGNLLFLVSDGKLYLSNDGGTPVEISGVEDIGGRISIANQYQEFVVIKTESAVSGDSDGYLIDISDVDNVEGHKLFLPTPDDDSLTILRGSEDENEMPAIAAEFISGVLLIPGYVKAINPDGKLNERIPEGRYLYRITYVREHHSRNATADQIPEDDVRNGWESPAGTAHSVTLRTIDDTKYNTVSITVVHSTDSSVTGIRVYRNDGRGGDVFREIAQPTFANADGSIVRGYIPKPVTTIVDRTTAAQWEQGRMLDLENDKLPVSAFGLTFYNGLLFAPNGDELRYNDRRLGISELYIWPESNQLNYPALWSVSYQGYLYFGDKGNTYVLSGTGEGIPPFQVRRVDSVGALNPYCAGITMFGLTIIAATGIWVSQGSQFTKISTGLDEVFRDTQIIDGSMLQLPDRTVLFDVQFGDATRKQYLASQVQGAVVFFAWSSVDMLQGVNIELDEVTIAASETEWAANGVVWLFDGGEPSVTHTLIATEGADRISEIEWNTEETYNEDATWRIESNDVFQSEKAQMARKLNRRLIFNAVGEGDVDAVFYVDDTEIEKTATLRDGKPTRIPIRRRGNKMNFELSGTGRIEARGLLLEYEPLRNY